jgi:hypothetical protein
LTFLVTEEALGVTSSPRRSSALTGRRPRLPAGPANAVTQEHHHVQRSRGPAARRSPIATGSDAAFDGGGVGLFSTLEIVENFDWPSVAKVRAALEGLGIATASRPATRVASHEYPGDPLARGVGTPVSHTVPQ